MMEQYEKAQRAYSEALCDPDTTDDELNEMYFELCELARQYKTA